MKSARPAVLLLLLSFVSAGQQPRHLPLTPHKILYADTVYREAVARRDPKLFAEAYFLYGKAYFGANDILNSQRWFLKSLHILEPLGDSYQLSRVCQRLSDNAIAMEHYPEALRYARLAFFIARRVKSRQALQQATGCLATIHEIDWSKGGKIPNWPVANRDSAVFYRHISEVIFNQNVSVPARIERYVKEGEQLWRERKDPRSLELLRKGLALAIRENEYPLRLMVMVRMAAVYQDQGQLPTAIRMLREADSLFVNSVFKHSYGDQRMFAVAFRDYYIRAGNWREAYRHAAKLNELQLNHYILNRDGAVTRLSMEYETEKKEALVRSQQQELRLRNENLEVQRRFLIAVSALLMLTIAMTVIFFRLYRKNKRISALNAELVREQNHRVKNNLQAISSLLNLQGRRLSDDTARRAVEDTQLRVEAIAILQRRLYDEDRLTATSLDLVIPEVAEMVLHTFSFGDLQPAYDLSPVRLSPDYVQAVCLIVTELTTNACKYAFPEHPQPGFSVSCRVAGRQVFLRVRDNGPGFSAGAARKSFGMNLIQMQVHQLGGTCQFFSRNGLECLISFPV